MHGPRCGGIHGGLSRGGPGFRRVCRATRIWYVVGFGSLSRYDVFDGIARRSSFHGDYCVTDNAATIRSYLDGPGPFLLEIGRPNGPKPGWLTLDLAPSDQSGEILTIDATEPLPFPDRSFDYLFTEHMIEHISFSEGLSMLGECRRILKPGGVIRVATPSLGMLLRVVTADRSAREGRYLRWSIESFVPEAPVTTPAFFLNNFMRNWGHKFIYDRETLEVALRVAGFTSISERSILESDHNCLRGLEDIERLPPGLLEFETMILEAARP